MALDYTLNPVLNRAEGPQRPKVPVGLMGSQSGNQTLTLGHTMRELLLSNDHASAALTLTVHTALGDLSFSVKAGEVLDERYPVFESITVAASGAWRYIARSGELV